ncbi:chromosome segregation protein SMC [Demetria terragena]|uniref:chromosome segregation protein SMC n=1 Tax=Demetria terragena TaxID=63959 RepID=UPI00037B5477|nr:chromosome segregation protein SMC [Demetria terragena]
MYVKSLTLKGFKSFASATAMTLEPGITCIVGPNGSGKSNVVDALAWVMGEQGAKSLRGGKMEDVIFAGTSNRPALGRAEVTLTIDNSDGALPIDYTEVTISRTMFRGGGSEYRINGTSVRLLDIQELLSDSGIGREMHIIVGQGQLDTVLRATPEDRRGFIEEAAGVLKHRKRKEKALRKLESMAGDLNRLNDLTDEIRRQLGPLGRQAETARRAVTIQADVRDARFRILADDLVQLTGTLEQEVADEKALLERRGLVEQSLASVKAELSTLEQQAEQARPALARAQEQWYSLGSLKERLSATESLAGERVRLLGQDEEDQRTTGRDPEKLRQQAAELRSQELDLLSRVERAQTDLQQAVNAKGAAEQAYEDEQKRIARLARAAADRREGLAKLQGQVAARQSRIEAADAEIGRLQERIVEAVERAQAAERRYGDLESSIADTEAGEVDLDARYEVAVDALEKAEQDLAEVQEADRGADRDRSTFQARVDALEMSLRRKDGGATLLEKQDQHPGVQGAVSGLLRVTEGHEAALAAALGWAAEGIVVDDLDAAGAAIDSLRDSDGGRVMLLVGDTAAPVEVTSWPALPAGCTWARDEIEAPEAVRAAVDALLDQVALAPDRRTARALIRDGVTSVTPEGDVYAPGSVRGGSADAPSLLELEAAADEARQALQEAGQRKDQAQFKLAELKEKVATLKSAAAAALDELNDNDAQMSAVAEQLGQLGQTMRGASAERERHQSAIDKAQESLVADRATLEELQQRLAAAQEEPTEDEPTHDERESLAKAAAAARTAETDVRLALRTLEEQARSIGGRAGSLETAVRSELDAREKARQRREKRQRDAQVARAVGQGAAYTLNVVTQLLTIAESRRTAAEQEQAERNQSMGQIRTRMQTLSDELRELTDSVHRDEIARAEQRLRIENLQTKAVDELGIDPEVLCEEYGPHQLIPYVPGPDDDPDSDDLPEPKPYVRAEQEKRLRSAERKLSQLGKVNPLALEEFAAMEERHKFLTEQLEDLRGSRDDLMEIVTTIDERVKTVFAEAFADTAEQFAGVFSRLFPGGEGRLVLTDPDDMLTTGIEVEARPPGKKIKRLSLLSGGERSLVAVALLVSIFKARPSPFYIMDEVEAALDDANLGRLITLFEELRGSSQLIVITHQKRTMEVADALYGVSMRGDGVTTVVSQRLRDVADDQPPGGGDTSDSDVAEAS